MLIFIYNNILLGENLYSLIRAHMRKFMSIFLLRAIIYTVYCWKKYQNCKAHTHARIFCLDFSLHLNEVSKEKLLELAWTNPIL